VKDDCWWLLGKVVRGDDEMKIDTTPCQSPVLSSTCWYGCRDDARLYIIHLIVSSSQSRNSRKDDWEWMATSRGKHETVVQLERLPPRTILVLGTIRKKWHSALVGSAVKVQETKRKKTREKVFGLLLSLKTENAAVRGTKRRLPPMTEPQRFAVLLPVAMPAAKNETQ